MKYNYFSGFDQSQTYFNAPAWGSLVNIESFNVSLDSVNNTFENLYNDQMGGVFLIWKYGYDSLYRTFSDINSTYNNITARLSCGCYCKRCNLRMSDFRINQCFSQSSVAFYIDNDEFNGFYFLTVIKQLDILNSIIENSSSKSGYLFRQNARITQARIDNFVLRNFTSNIIGSFFYSLFSLKTSEKIDISNMVVQDLNIGPSGSGDPAIQLQSNFVQMRNVSILPHNIQLRLSSFFSIYNTPVSELQNVSLLCSYTEVPWSTIRNSYSIGQTPYLSAFQFFLNFQIADRITNTNFQMRNCYIQEGVTDHPCAIRFNEIKNYTQTNSTYQYITASHYSLYYYDGTYSSQSLKVFLFRNMSFLNVYSNKGFMIISDASLNLTMERFNVTNFRSDGGQAFLLYNIAVQSYLTQSYIILKDSVFQTIYAKTNTKGIFYLRSPFIQNAQMLSTTFTDLENVQGGLIYCEKYLGSVIVQNVTALRLSSFYNGRVIYANVPTYSQSSFLIRDSFIDFQEYSMKNTYPYTDLNSAFYIKNSLNGLELRNVSINNCQNASMGSLAKIVSSKLKIVNSSFSNFTAVIGGFIYTEKSVVDIQNSQFSNSWANRGGFLSSFDLNTVTISNITVKNITAQQGGGIFDIVVTSDLSQLNKAVYLQMNNSDIVNATGYTGGIVFSNNPQAKISFYNNSVQNSQSLTQGGFAQILQCESFILSRSRSILSKSVLEGNLLYSSASLVQIILEYTQLVSTTPDSQFLSPLVQIFGAKSVAFRFLTVKNYFLPDDCLFQIFGTSSIQDENNVYENNTGSVGSIFMLTGSSIQIKNSTFLNNTASIGGAISLQDNCLGKIQNSTFRGNSAKISSGVILVRQSSNIEIYSSSFEFNTAPQQSVLEVLNSNTSLINVIQNSKFSNNTSQQVSISLINSDCTIKDSQFIDNIAYDISKNLLLGYGNITIQNSTFSYTSFSITQSSQIDNTIGGFIFIIAEVLLSIRDSVFENSKANQGGAIFLQNDSKFKAVNTTFQNNYAATAGGAIQTQGYREFSLINCTFKDNKADINGDDIYLDNSMNVAYINQTYIQNQKGSTSIHAEKVSIMIADSQIRDVNYMQGIQSYGSALHCLDCYSLVISNSTFQNCSSIFSGALYLEQTQEQKDLNQQLDYMITNSSFINNKSPVGGAIFISNIKSVEILGCEFNSNKAIIDPDFLIQENQGSGGSIYFTCQNSDCTLKISQNTSFSNNRAELEGGAIFWDEVEPQINDQETTFLNNSARLYGSNIACYAQNLGQISKSIANSYLQENRILSSTENRALTDNSYLDKVEFQAQFSLFEQVSGGYIEPLYIALIDKYGQIVGSDSKSKLRIIVNSTFNQNSKANLYPPVIEGTNLFSMSNGITKIENVILSATPGQNYSIIAETDAIETTKTTNKQYLESSSLYDLNLHFDVNLRNCILGEQFTSNGKCQMCLAGTFSLELQNSPSLCSSCPDYKAYCYGGSQFGPKAGYWRKNNQSSIITECPYLESCLGMVTPENNPLGACSTGYRGILCSDCEIGYSRQSETKCGQCPSKAINIVRITFILAGVILLLVILIRSTLKGAQNSRNITNIYLKILMNHIQLLMMTSTIDFSWTDEIKQFFSQNRQIATAPAQIFSFDCLIDERVKVNETDYYISDFYFGYQSGYYSDTRIFFKKMIMIAVLPFALIGLCVISWYLIKVIIDFQTRRKKAKQELKESVAYDQINQSATLNAPTIQIIDSTKKKKSKSSQKELQGDLGVQDSKGSTVKSLITQNKQQNLSQINEDKISIQNQSLVQTIDDKNGYRITEKIVASIVIVLFLVHPSIVQYMFYDFKCKEFDGEHRVLNDLEVVCWGQEHSTFSYIVAIPSIIIWGLGIPMFALIVMVLVKNKLDLKSVREQYGFIYRGYKVRFFFWEIVIMYRKVIIIFIAVFINQFGLIVQALVVLLFLILFLLLNSQSQPYVTVILNELESISLIASITTIYCGILFILNKPQSWIENNPVYSQGSIYLSEKMSTGLFAIILAVNIIFFSLWVQRMYLEIRNRLIKTLPRIYTMVCLCNDERSFKKLQLNTTVREEHLHLNEKFDLLIKDMKNLVQGKDKEILTNEGMARLRLHLSKDFVFEYIGQKQKKSDSFFSSYSKLAYSPKPQHKSGSYSAQKDDKNGSQSQLLSLKHRKDSKMIQSSSSKAQSNKNLDAIVEAKLADSTNNGIKSKKESKSLVNVENKKPKKFKQPKQKKGNAFDNKAKRDDNQNEQTEKQVKNQMQVELEDPKSTLQINNQENVSKVKKFRAVDKSKTVREGSAIGEREKRRSKRHKQKSSQKDKSLKDPASNQQGIKFREIKQDKEKGAHKVKLHIQDVAIEEKSLKEN